MRVMEGGRRRAMEPVYLYRAVDKAGKTVDFYLSVKRDVNAAKSFLHRAMKSQRIPTKITLDAYAASHRAITELTAMGELPMRVRLRTSKHLNNAIEQHHRRVKQRLRPMLGLKSFPTAAVVIGGIELAGKSRRDSSSSESSATARQRCPKSGELRWLLK
jgi:transposase-like protein